MGSKRTAAAAVECTSRPPSKASTVASTVLIYSLTTYLNAIFDGGDEENYTTT